MALPGLSFFETRPKGIVPAMHYTFFGRNKTRVVIAKNVFTFAEQYSIFVDWRIRIFDLTTEGKDVWKPTSIKAYNPRSWREAGR
jgi:hypothetical protein